MGSEEAKLKLIDLRNRLYVELTALRNKAAGIELAISILKKKEGS